MPFVLITMGHIEIYLDINHHHCQFWPLPIFTYNGFLCLTWQFWWCQLMTRYNHEINWYSIDILYGNTMTITTCSGGIEYEPSTFILPYNSLRLSTSIFEKHQISEFFGGDIMFLKFYMTYARSWLILLLYLDTPDSLPLIYHETSLRKNPSKCCDFWTRPVIV